MDELWRGLGGGNPACGRGHGWRCDGLAYGGALMAPRCSEEAREVAAEEAQGRRLDLRMVCGGGTGGDDTTTGLWKGSGGGASCGSRGLGGRQWDLRRGLGMEVEGS
ncbi:hypothetical protein GUJ93_ZPchr0002g26630 [Zizania palustris]|uniref:Uncharacterized protein n=1 Tax=Zizania palustris TaxID=103762 RepID=A0A8J5VUI6_ZIZPA|nr:hypothetical protein GUJ93_ZPchr0002g26630 [Zizania palustris]